MATVGSIVYSVGAEISGFKKAFQEADAELRRVGARSATLNEETRKLSGVMNRIANDVRLATAHFQSGKLSLEGYQQAVATARVQAAALDQATGKAGRATRSAGAGFGRMRETITALAVSMTGVHPQLARVGSVLSSLAFGGALTVGVVAGAAAIGFAWKQMHEAGRIAAESAKQQMKEFGALIDKIKSKLQDLALWQLAAQRMNLETSLRIAKGELETPALKRVAVEKITEGKDFERFQQVRENVKRIELALADLGRIAADKTWARNMAAAGEEAARGLDQVHVSLTDVLNMIRNIPLDPANFGTRIKKTLADQLAKDMEELAKTNEAMAEKIQRDFGATVDQMERDAQRAAEAINRIQFALNAMLDILDDLKAGNFGSVLGTIFGGIIGFAASGGNPAGAIAGAQIGGRVGRNFDSPNQSAAAIPPGAATISVNVSGMPPATNPLAASRDGDWIRFLSESTKVAKSRGMV